MGQDTRFAPMDGLSVHSTQMDWRSSSAKPSGLAVFAWLLLGYLMLVILFGAWVRITGSGAGCGSHWPTCHGEVIPRSPGTATLIEFTHRATSGLLGILALGLVAWTWIARAARPVRIAAFITLFFVVVEALIGAGIVLEELVGSDDSAARASVVAIHLLSTFSLTAATGLAAWWSSGRPSPDWRSAPSAKWWLATALAAVAVVSMTGAITALGDTLFPVRPTGHGLFVRLADDLAPAAHFLVRLRIVHPIVAIGVGIALIALPTYLPPRSTRLTRLLTGLRHAVLFQMALGGVNIALGAPGWLQLAHLLAAQGVWLVLVFAAAEASAALPAPANAAP